MAQSKPFAQQGDFEHPLAQQPLEIADLEPQARNALVGLRIP
jgi:hypothetical protein